MKAKRIAALGIAAAALGGVGPSAGAQPPPAAVPGVVLVGYRAGVSAPRRAAVAAEARAVDRRTIGNGTHVLEVPVGKVDAAIATLRHDPAVRYAEPDYMVHADATPNDPFLGSLWALQAIRAADAWNLTTGDRNIVVGVVDTGVDYTHPDLAANVWANPGGIGGCPAGTHGVDALGSDCDPQDEHYHGTHVAGTIGAVGNNGVGVVGIDWNVSLMALRFLDSKGNGNVGDAIAAIDFAVKAKQAGVNMRVLNNSWGGSGFSQALLDEIQKAGANDILFVDAAGNSGDNLDVSPSYPASYVAPNELTVAATDASDQLATFSSYGSGSVDLAAPGVEIYSTVPGGYTFLSGTSMAAPQVSGAAALLLARCSASASQVKATIRQSAVALPALAGRTANGGRLDVLGAVANCTPPLESTFPPAIAGAAQEGRTLTATTGSWNRGPLTYAYQWRHCLPASSACADIPGAQEPSYVVGAADVDSSLRVTVTASDGATTASAVSAPTAAALPAAPRNTNVPAIVGRPRRGSKLSATRGEWQSSRPLSFAFQWQRCGRNSGCVAIPGATGASYRVVAADTGRSLRVVVSASNAGGSAAARSPARAVAAAAPWISGTPKVGHVLRAHAGTAGRFRYQWLRCTGHRCSAIRRASSPRYRIRRADIGRRLKVRVTAAGRSPRGHNSSSTSRATAVVRR